MQPRYVFKSQNFQAIDTPNIVERRGKDWVDFGDNNLYPEVLITLFNNSAMHRTAIDAKFDGTIGEGIKYFGDSPINSNNETINEIFEKIALDYIVFGGYALNVIWAKDSERIAEIYHLPFQTVRSGKLNEDDCVDEYYYCSDWQQYRKYKPVAYKAFSTTDNKKENASQIYYCFDYTLGNVYYPLPSYVGAINDIDLDARVSRFHNSNVSNGLAPSMMLTFRNGIPTPDEQDEIWKDINNTFGSQDNAGKFFLNFAEPGREPTLEAIQNSNDTYYITLEERISSRVLTSHRITSPLLLGIRDGSGLGSNKDEILVAYEHFMNTVIKPIQKTLLNTFNYIINLKGDTLQLEIEPNKIIAIEEVTAESFSHKFSIENASAGDDYSSFFVKLLAARDQVHVFHWQTKSAPLHTTLGEFYDTFLLQADAIAEMVMGVQDRPILTKGNIELIDYSEENMLKFIDEVYYLLTVTARKVIHPQHEDIFSEIEVLIAEINKLRYLITLK